MQSEQLTHFAKCPPSKRPNFFHYGITSPFRPLWSIIVRDWAMECDPANSGIDASRFDVLRDRRRPSMETLRQHLLSLVPIRLIIKGNKGVIDASALVYLPADGDLRTNSKSIVESRHSDRARIEERKMKKAKQSYHRGQTMIQLIDERVNNGEQPVIHDCDRKLLGAVTSGSFQFSRACCTGKGFIAAGALLTLLQQQESKTRKTSELRVLVRTTASQYYRWGSLEF